MKKIRLKSSVLAGAFALFLLFPGFKDLKSSKLTDITKPYLGIYECQQAEFGDTDYLEKFSYIRLELKPEGEFVLYYCPKNGKSKEEKGKYRYDKEKGTLTLYSEDFAILKREFPLEKGMLTITLPIGDKTLNMQFAQQ